MCAPVSCIDIFRSDRLLFNFRYFIKMQLLRNTPCLRLMQMIDIGCTLILASLALLTLCVAVNDYQMIPYETIELVEVLPSGKHQTSAKLIATSLHGLVSMSAICTLFSLIAAIAAACERRVFLLIISCTSGLITLLCLSFGTLSLIAKGKSIEMINEFFKQSVNEYTNFTSPQRGYMMQRLVDRIQFDARCCGYKNHYDYEKVFQSFIINYGEYIVCLSEPSAGPNFTIGAQQIPFSCCPDYKVSYGNRPFMSPLCTAAKFDWKPPENICTTAGNVNVSHYGVGCEKKLAEFSDLFTMLSALILIAGVITCVISALSGILAINIVTPKEEVIEALCKEFDLTKAQIAELERAVDAGQGDGSTQIGSGSDKYSEKSDMTRLRERASKMAKTNRAKANDGSTSIKKAK